MSGMSATIPATLGPPIPIPTSVHLGLTVAFTVLYSLLFFMVYIQLWMILYYKHKRFSHQTIFLTLCLIWAGLRTTLFSFYFMNCTLANNLPMFPNWLLYSLPVCLQFITLCLLVVYFSQVLHKATAAHREQQKSRFVPVITSLAILVFLTTNVICAILTFIRQRNGGNVQLVAQFRVIINDLLFLLFGVYLAICIARVTRTQSANLVLQAKGTSRCQSATLCVLIIVLYTTRAIYNIVAVTCPKIPSFGYSWINVSAQAELTDLDQGIAYVSFGAVLFIWEFLPTFIVVLYFKVKIPTTSVTVSDMSTHSHGSKAYFFDNPRRYDSDDDLSSRSHVSPTKGGLYDASSSPHYLINAGGLDRQSWRGSPQSAPNRRQPSSALLSSNSFPGNQYGMPDSTPPVLFTAVQHHTPRQMQPFYDGT